MPSNAVSDNERQPTAEQAAIVADRSRVLRVNARAGTGKTTTLQMLARAHPRRKILYLVFNHRARVHAQKTFPANVTVHTVHSLAYQSEGRRWQSGADGAFKDCGPTDLLPFFDGRSRHRLAGITRDFLVFFLNSPHPQLEDAVAHFAGRLQDPARGLFNDHSAAVVAACRGLATRWYRKDLACPHDFYLKLFHKSGDFDRALDRFDLVLVDEAQDLSPIMVDVLGRCRKRVVIVGDSHQQIYGFRYAVDAMQRLPAEAELDLTLSFRFGKPVADFTRWFIRSVKEDRTFTLYGNPHVRSRLALGAPSPDAACALLSRSNLALFTRAIQFQSLGWRFRFERDIGKVLYATLDVFHLFQGDKNRIRNDWIRSFGDFEALKTYVEEQEDFQLKAQVQVVEQYHRLFPGIVFDLVKLSEAGSQKQSQADLILTTVHSAKGQEYNRVWVHGDVAQTLSAANKANSNSFLEEANIAYVAFTRARHQLLLAKEFQTIGGLADWHRNYIGRQPQRSKPTEGRERATGKSRKVPASVRRTRNRTGHRAGGPSSRPAVQVGDRVMTAHGYGQVVQIKGEYCWVVLENTGVRLREWLERVKPGGV